MTPGDAYEAAIRYAVAVGGSGITSAWRAPARNTRVGGVALSAHLLGTAFDVGFEPGAPSILIAEQRQTLAKRLGFRLVVEPDHDHLQVL